MLEQRKSFSPPLYKNFIPLGGKLAEPFQKGSCLVYGELVGLIGMKCNILPSQKIDMGTLTSAKLCVDSIAVVPNVLWCVFAELSTKRKNWENVRRLILEDLNYDHNWWNLTLNVHIWHQFHTFWPLIQKNPHILASDPKKSSRFLSNLRGNRVHKRPISKPPFFARVHIHDLWGIWRASAPNFVDFRDFWAI